MKRNLQNGKKVREKTTDMQYIDLDVKTFLTYKYKIISYSDNFGERIYSRNSDILSVYVCKNNVFPQGRYNFNPIKGCKLDKKRNNIFPSSNNLTKKEIYSRMAKKSGGGTYR